MLENQELQEGVNDLAIFKAVFLAGGPGSGKSFIGTETKGKSPTVGGDPKEFMGGGQLGLINLGLRVVNPDPAYEKLLKGAGLDAKNSDDIWSDKGQEIRVKATDITAKQKSLYVDGRLGVIIDGTGKDVNKIMGQKKLLDKVGYECAMIYVNTNLETAIARDQKRNRTIGAEKVTEMWNAVQKNLKKYASMFGKSNMYVIDNSNGSNWQSEAKKAHKKLEKWIRKDPSDPKAKDWIEGQKMRNAPKSGIKEEDSHYLPGYTAGFYGYDPETSRSKMQDLHHDIRKCSSINDACNTVAEKWKSKLAEMSKLNATHLDDLDDEDIEKLLPIAVEMRKEQMSLIDESVELDEAKSQGMFVVLEKGSKNKVIGQFKDKSKAVDMMKKNDGSKVIQIGKFATDDDKPVDIKVGDELPYTRVKLATKIKEEVELDENFIAFDLEHEVLTHFQTKADGMKWKNHKNAPDSYYLVKTKHRLLKGDMASEGSDSLSKHLDSQPFPHKDGPHFSVHKESVKDAKKKMDESVELPEGFLDELSPKTKKSYKDKATRAIGNEKKYSDTYSDAAEKDSDNPIYKKRADKHKRKLKNRIDGVSKADESVIDELSMTKSDLTKTGMKVDSKKMAEIEKELKRLRKGLKKESIDESTRFENESAEMVMRDLIIMQNKIVELVEMMDSEMGAPMSLPISLEPWIVAKITKAKDYVDSIHDYTVMDNENE